MGSAPLESTEDMVSRRKTGAGKLSASGATGTGEGSGNADRAHLPGNQAIKVISTRARWNRGQCTSRASHDSFLPLDSYGRVDPICRSQRETSRLKDFQLNTAEPDLEKRISTREKSAPDCVGVWSYLLRCSIPTALCPRPFVPPRHPLEHLHGWLIGYLNTGKIWQVPDLLGQRSMPTRRSSRKWLYWRVQSSRTCCRRYCMPDGWINCRKIAITRIAGTACYNAPRGGLNDQLERCG